MEDGRNAGNEYLITAPGFVYDTRRGVLCAGSRVSKAVHPLADVESLKSRLIAEGAIVPAADSLESSEMGQEGTKSVVKKRDYFCARDIETGPLMAFNLCRDSLQKELPDVDIAYMPGNDELVSANEALKLWSMYTMDSSFRARIERDSYRVIKLFEAEYDRTFVNGKGDGTLSKVEQFVVDALLAAGAIDDFRRGDPAFRECDIVDDKRMRQIEFVSLFDEKVPPRFRYRSELNEEQALLMEYCDFGYNIVAAGVINKFTLKNYTDRYSKELAIYMLGPNKEAADKVKALIGMLSARIDQIRNNYTKIHIILHDPLENETFAYCSNDQIQSFPDSMCTYNIIERHNIWPEKPEESCSDSTYRPDSEEILKKLQSDKNYIIVKQSIFDPEQRSLHWVKGDMVRIVL